MISKDMLLFIGFGILFILISFIVFVTRGNNPYFLRKKLRLGAFLITVSVSLGLIGCYYPITHCYGGSPNTYAIFQEDVDSDHVIEINLSINNVLSGKIRWGENKNYLYKITQTDQENKTIDILSAPLMANDGTFDDAEEDFKLTLPVDLISGTYTLEIIESADYGDVIGTFELIIVSGAKITMYENIDNNLTVVTDTKIDINMSELTDILGTVQYIQDKNLFYKIVNLSGAVIAENKLLLTSLSSQQGSYFTITLDSAMQTGVYTLLFYLESVDDFHQIAQYELGITRDTVHK